jgi:hypothetical protein
MFRKCKRITDKRFFISLILISLCLGSFSQEKDLIIKDIRAKFKEINDYNNYQKIVLDNKDLMEQMTDGGGQLTAYLKNDSICKIYEWIGLSFGVHKTEYYYWDEKLFFAYCIEETFEEIKDSIDGLIGFDYTKLNTTFEGRYYFYNDSILDVKHTGNMLFGLDTELELRNSLLESSIKNIEMITIKK